MDVEIVRTGGASARLDDALRVDVDGVVAAVARAKERGVPVLLVSSLAAVGQKKGLVAEEDPLAALFGGSTTRGRDIDVERELRACRAAVDHAVAQASFADRESRLLDEARRRLRELGGASSGSALARAVDDARAVELARDLEKALVERAAGWRFATGSAFALRGYTQALAELVVAQSGVPFAVVRAPAVVDEPLGFLLDKVRAGVLRFPLSGRLEALPHDVIEAAVDVVARGLAQSQQGGVVHLTSAAPLLPSRLTDLLDLHLRRMRLGARPAEPAPLQGMQQAAPLQGMQQAAPLEGMQQAAPLQGMQQAAPLQGMQQAPLQAAQRVLSVDTAGAQVPGADVVARALDALAALVPKAVKEAVPLVDEMVTAAQSVVDVDPALRARGASPPFFVDDTRFSTRGLRLFAARAGTAAPSLEVDWRALLLDDELPALDHAIGAKKRAQAQLPRPAWDSLAHLLEEIAARYGSRPALSMISGDDVVDFTYRDLEERARAVALRLQKAGVGPGDRVILSGQNHPHWGIAAFGVFLARATLVPLDPQNLDAEQVQNIVKKARPSCAIVDVVTRNKLAGALPEPVFDLALLTSEGPGLERDAPAPAPDDVASILFTSGTTGEPKGVQLTHKNFCALLSSLQAIFPVGGGDRMLSVLPLHHTFEFSCGLLMPLASGARVFTPDALTGERVLFALKKGRITALVGIPALWQLLERRISKQAAERGDVVKGVLEALLAANRAFGKATGLSFGRIALKQVHDELGGHLRTLISGGSALPPGVHDMFQGLGLPLAEGYGLTEAAPVLTVAEGKLGAPAGTVGRPIPGVELRIVDADATTGVGEVWARAPNVMKGYFENDDATGATLVDGWLKTGDLGFIDDDGRLHLVGRSKDVVVTATGENVYLDDIEKKLEPLVKEDGALVAEYTLLGVADPRGGERLALAWVIAAGEGVDAAAAHKRVQQQVQKLPAYARPSVVERVAGPLPLTATRKVKRKEVRAALERTLAERGAGAVESAGMPALRAAVAVVAGVDAKKIAGGTRLAADLGFDSLMWTELGASLAKIAGGAPLDPEKLVQNESVADLENFVRAAAFSERHSAADAAGDHHGEAGALEAGALEAVERAELAVKSAALTLRDVAFAAVKPLGRAAISTAQREAYRTLFRAKVSGQANIPHNRNAIVIANHTSHLDTGLVKFALGTYGEDLRPLAAKDYFFEGAAPKVAFFEHFTNLVPIDRETGSGLAFEQARAVVDAGHVVLIFPEGTRREDGTLGAFKPLVARLSLLTGVDVLPIWMKGNYEALPRGTHVPNLDARDLEAHIGPPLAAKELARLTAHLPPVQQAREATAILRRAIVALSEGKALDLSRVKALADLERGVVVVAA